MENELRQAIIEDFECEKERLLGYAKEANTAHRFFITNFMSHQFLPVSAKYDKEMGKFTELSLSVADGENVKFETIEL